MTDTIGWGDVDIEVDRRARRRRIARIGWPLLVLIVAGVVLTPLVTDRLADGAARWLQREWALQNAYGGARASTLASVEARIGIGDRPTFVALVRSIDQQEVSRLTSIQRAVIRHRTWSSDVARAKRAVRRALAGQIHDLRTQMATIAATENDAASALAPAPLSTSTFALVEAVTDAVARAARAHHVHDTTRPAVGLDAGGAIVEQLMRVTSRPLALHLVLAQADGLADWDLRTGKHHVVPAPVGDLVGPTMPVVGGTLLVQTQAGYTLVPLDGSRPRRLPGPGPYLGDGRGSLWRVTGGAVQRMTAEGRAIGRPRPLPAGFDASVGFATPGATGLVTISRFEADPRNPGLRAQTTYFWDPLTGGRIGAADSCGNISSTSTLAVYGNCDGTALHLVDLRTGHDTAIALPADRRSASLPLISPGGRRVAISLSDPRRPDQAATQVAVFDLATRRTEVVLDQPQLQPLAWAPDGATVVLAATNESGLAYWTAGMRNVAAIRIPMDSVQPQLAVLR